MIPYGRQAIDDDDIAAVTAVLRSDRLTQGPSVERFEQALVEATDASYAVAFASGTAALHAASAAAGLGPRDVVATSALSFVASANCAAYVGASVRLVDIDPATWNLDLSAVPEDVDALVAVHFAGLPVDLREMRRRPRVVIEDAAHAIGALTPDGPVGNCAHSDLCCFSFHAVKTITTGEGGAVTTNDPHLADRLRRFRHHGIVPTPDDGGWCYDIAELGWNYRLTDLQAALGTSQLGKLDRFVTRRNALAARYRDELSAAPLTLPPDAPSGWRHGRHLFPVLVDERRRVYEELVAGGIGVQVHYVPISRLSLYRRDRGAYPVADAVYQKILSLPLFPSLTEAEQDEAVARLRGALRV